MNLPERSCFHNQASSEQYYHGEQCLQLSSNSDSAPTHQPLSTRLSVNPFIHSKKRKKKLTRNWRRGFRVFGEERGANQEVEEEDDDEKCEWMGKRRERNIAECIFLFLSCAFYFSRVVVLAVALLLCNRWTGVAFCSCGVEVGLTYRHLERVWSTCLLRTGVSICRLWWRLKVERSLMKNWANFFS